MTKYAIQNKRTGQYLTTSLRGLYTKNIEEAKLLDTPDEVWLTKGECFVDVLVILEVLGKHK